MSTKQTIAYQGRITDLQTALGAGDVKGALIAAGDCLRRTSLLGIATKEIETSISKLTQDQVMSYVGSIDASAMHERLARGLEEAFEVLLADNPSERAMWEKEAMQALRERDSLESARVAIEMRLGRLDVLDAKIAAVDAGLSKNARCLVGLNGLRREELAQLDPGAREGAWWYAARAQSDALGEVLAGRKGPDVALSALGVAHGSCAEDRRDLERLAGIETPPKRVDSESLWLSELGTASKERSRFVEKHLDAKDKKALDVDID